MSMLDPHDHERATQVARENGQRQREATLAEQRGIELADMLARIGEFEEELRGEQAEIDRLRADIDRLRARQGDRVKGMTRMRVCAGSIRSGAARRMPRPV